ncbi:MAG: Gfo/Idh/MocA family oxidoreductase, partial [Clostridiales bacterium]|nr:Gfo/Idh/MocA family oxidoreductase [Clostridiales bacterium]
MANKDFGLCFIGSGGIARRVLADLSKHSEGCYLASNFSRNFEHAQKLADECGGIACKTAEEALSAPGVKAVYVCTPHTSHKDRSIEALKKGLPVLVEKPAATTLADLQEMVDTAHANKAFFMEGMWTAHNPTLRKAVEWIKEGRIGKLHSLQAAFSFHADFNPKNRLYDPSLGGGALYDVGVYVIALSRLIFPEMPSEIKAVADFAQNGVDSQCAISLKYPGGGISRLFCGITSSEPDDCLISGEKGFIKLEKFWASKKARLFVGR